MGQDLKWGWLWKRPYIKMGYDGKWEIYSREGICVARVQDTKEAQKIFDQEKERKYGFGDD